VKNPYYEKPRVSAFSAAAAALDEFFRQNSEKSEVTEKELLAIPAVSALASGGVVTSGVKGELAARVLDIKGESDLILKNIEREALVSAALSSVESKK